MCMSPKAKHLDSVVKKRSYEEETHGDLSSVTATSYTHTQCFLGMSKNWMTVDQTVTLYMGFIFLGNSDHHQS